MGCEMTSITPCLLYFLADPVQSERGYENTLRLFDCGHQAPKWLGRCPDCGEWSTFVEEVRESKKVVGFAERATRQKAGWQVGRSSARCPSSRVGAGWTRG